MTYEWKPFTGTLHKETIRTRRLLGYDDNLQPIYADVEEKAYLTDKEWQEWYQEGGRELWEQAMARELKRRQQAELSSEINDLYGRLFGSADTIAQKRIEQEKAISQAVSSDTAGTYVDIEQAQKAEIARLEALIAKAALNRDEAALKPLMEQYNKLKPPAPPKEDIISKAGRAVSTAIETVKKAIEPAVKTVGEAAITTGEITKETTPQMLSAVAEGIRLYEEYPVATIGALFTGRIPGTMPYEQREALAAVSLDKEKTKKAFEEYVAAKQRSVLENINIGREQFVQDVEKLSLGEQMLVYAIFDPLLYTSFSAAAKALTLPVRLMVNPASRAALISAGIIRAGEAVDTAFAVPIVALKWLAEKGGRAGYNVLLKVVRRAELDMQERELVRQSIEATRHLVEEAEKTTPRTSMAWDEDVGSWYFEREGRRTYINDLPLLRKAEKLEAPEIVRVEEGAPPGTIGEAYEPPKITRVRTEGGFVYDEAVPVEVARKAEPEASPSPAMAKSWSLTFRDGRWGFDIYYADGTIGRADAPMFNPKQEYPKVDDKGVYLQLTDGGRAYIRQLPAAERKLLTEAKAEAPARVAPESMPEPPKTIEATVEAPKPEPEAPKAAEARKAAGAEERLLRDDMQNQLMDTLDDIIKSHKWPVETITAKTTDGGEKLVKGQSYKGFVLTRGEKDEILIHGENFYIRTGTKKVTDAKRLLILLDDAGLRPDMPHDAGIKHPNREVWGELINNLLETRKQEAVDFLSDFLKRHSKPRAKDLLDIAYKSIAEKEDAALKLLQAEAKKYGMTLDAVRVGDMTAVRLDLEKGGRWWSRALAYVEKNKLKAPYIESVGFPKTFIFDSAEKALKFISEPDESLMTRQIYVRFPPWSQADAEKIARLNAEEVARRNRRLNAFWKMIEENLSISRKQYEAEWRKISEDIRKAIDVGLMDVMLEPEKAKPPASRPPKPETKGKGISIEKSQQRIEDLQRKIKAAKLLREISAAKDDATRLDTLTAELNRLPDEIIKEAREFPEYADMEITKLAALTGVPFMSVAIADELQDESVSPLWGLAAIPALALMLSPRGGSVRALEMLLKQVQKRPDFVSLPSDEYILNGRLKRDWFRRVAEAMGETPVLKGTVSLTNPSALVQDEVGKAMLVRLALQDYGESMKQLLMAYLRIQESPKRLFRIGMDNIAYGVRRRDPNASLAWGDVFEGAFSGKYDLTPAQIEYIKTYHTINDITLAMLKSEGIVIDEKEFAEGMHYVMRVVEAGDARIGKLRIGRKMSFEAERLFETMADGLSNNISYVSDPDKVMDIRIGSVIRRIADRRLADRIAPLGRIPTEETPATLYEKGIVHPAFGFRVFPVEVADKLNKVLGREANAWAKNVSTTAGVLRTLGLTMDFAAPFIQGVPVMGKPLIWTKATILHYETFFNPKVAQAYLIQNADVVKDAIMKGGVYIGEHEFFTGTGTLMKAAEKLAGEKGGRAIEETYGRFGAAFSAFGDIARIELWKAFSRRPDFAGREMEYGSFINRLTGYMSSKALGISPTQRSIESGFMWLAPRYTRAGIALVGDLIRGGPITAESWKMLAGTIAVGTGLYIATCRMLGQEPYLNPFTDGAKFMSIKIGDTWVGLGGIHLAMMRLLGDIIYDLNQEDAAQRIFPTKAEGESWEEYVARIRIDQPFLKWLFGRTSPVTGTAIDLFVGRNFVGEPFENAGQYAYYMASKLLPIGIKGGFEGGFDPARLVVSEIGLRAWPLSPADRRNGLREEIAGRYGRRWEELPMMMQKALEESEPELKFWTDEAKKRNLQQASPETRTRIMFETEKGRAQENYVKAVELAAKEVNDPEAENYRNYVAFRRKCQLAAKILSSEYERIYGNPKVAEMVAKWQEKAKERWDELKKDGVEQPIVDIAYDEYMTSIVLADDMEDAWGNFDFDKYSERVAAFKQKWGNEVYEYVRSQKAYLRAMPEEFHEYVKAVDYLEPYWAIEKQVKAYLEKKQPGAQDIIEKYQKLSSYITAEAMEQLRARYPVINTYNSMVTGMKRMARKNDPTVDYYLVKFYGLKPIVLQQR